jgi:hypothetical protein
LIVEWDQNVVECEENRSVLLSGQNYVLGKNSPAKGLIIATNYFWLCNIFIAITFGRFESFLFIC